MSKEITINRCQVCGEMRTGVCGGANPSGGIELETEGGFRFVCHTCGAHTQRCRGFDEAVRRWNELEVHNDVR